MTKLRPFAAKLAVAVLAAQLIAAPAAADHRHGSSAKVTLSGVKSFGISHRGKARVHRHFIAPKVHKPAAKAKLHHAKPVKKHHRSSFKRHKKKYYKYYTPRRRGFRHHKFHRGFARYRIK
ncbi:hypothetical protein [Ruegeria sp. HU-ET01832]|uniref:hypothetical protein n=1 Tax=Ruegeria sp. HU-ET01832 TaxID=3135906 RepID=UPI0033401AB0